METFGLTQPFYEYMTWNLRSKTVRDNLTKTNHRVCGLVNCRKGVVWVSLIKRLNETSRRDEGPLRV